MARHPVCQLLNQNVYSASGNPLGRVFVASWHPGKALWRLCLDTGSRYIYRWSDEVSP